MTPARLTQQHSQKLPGKIVMRPSAVEFDFFRLNENSLLNIIEVACNLSEMVFVRLSLPARLPRRLLITLLAVAARRHKGTATATATKRSSVAFDVFVNKTLPCYLRTSHIYIYNCVL